MHTLEVDGVGTALKVVRFTGTEALSELFHFAVHAVTGESALDLSGITGRGATLTMSHSDGSRAVRGIVRRVEVAEAGLGVGASYHFELVPSHYRLALRRDIRIFQGESATDVIKKVVEGAGLKI